MAKLPEWLKKQAAADQHRTTASFRSISTFSSEYYMVFIAWSVIWKSFNIYFKIKICFRTFDMIGSDGSDLCLKYCRRLQASTVRGDFPLLKLVHRMLPATSIRFNIFLDALPSKFWTLVQVQAIWTFMNLFKDFSSENIAFPLYPSKTKALKYFRN